MPHKNRLELTEEKHDPRSYDADMGYIYFQPQANEPRRCFAGRRCNLSVLTRAHLEVGGSDEAFIKGAYWEEGDMCLRILKAPRGN